MKYAPLCFQTHIFRAMKTPLRWIYTVQKSFFEGTKYAVLCIQRHISYAILTQFEAICKQITYGKDLYLFSTFLLCCNS